jgi:hypothetical protein
VSVTTENKNGDSWADQRPAESNEKIAGARLGFFSKFTVVVENTNNRRSRPGDVQNQTPKSPANIAKTKEGAQLFIRLLA